ncbi:MAG: hypothetical protein HWE27_11825 [Gammaproteobacteria bacterium]|nr:hypothetical protein [Gammaproteobacteria bacterium]
MDNKDPYYNPPEEWSFESIVSRYNKINNDCGKECAISFEFVAKLPEIIRIKKALQMISLELKSEDPGAIELSVSLVASPVYFHYSGYIRATMARRLKNCSLNARQKRELIKGIDAVLANKKLSYEFKEVKALYVKVKNDIEIM